jgi:hypothetical protein
LIPSAHNNDHKFNLPYEVKQELNHLLQSLNTNKDDGSVRSNEHYCYEDLENETFHQFQSDQKHAAGNMKLHHQPIYPYNTKVEPNSDIHKVCHHT